MGCLLKVTGAIVLSLGIQFVYIQPTFASLESHNSVETQNYEPPNNGGPDSSRGCGTR